MRPSTRFICVIIFAIAFLNIFSSHNNVSAQMTVTLNATNVGWYADNGFHNSENLNYLAGQIGNGSIHREFHNYLVFDLSGIQGTITNATVKITEPQFGYFSHDPNETYTMFDVSTPVSDLIMSSPIDNPAGINIFSDLGSGNSYGSLVLDATQNISLVSTSLNADGISALNSVRGPVAIGGALTSLNTERDEYVFGGSGDNDVVQLVLTIAGGNPTPTLSINDVSIVEGNTGESNAAFTVRRTGLATETTTVNYATTNGTATAGSDYEAASGTLTFAPGENSKTINVKVFGDTTTEANETFFVNLSTPTNGDITRGQATGTILNDDAPVASINDVSLLEGSDPNHPPFAQFTISLNVPSTHSISFNLNTVDGTATAPSDYTAISSTAMIPAGQTSVIVNVPIRADAVIEQDETFTVNINSSSDVTIARGTGTGTILNDDEAAYAGQILITEFRLRGVNGALDEFVELYNNTDADITVATTDNSNGWALAARDGIARFVIPNGTTIPARAHVLGVNSRGYSLAGYPAGEGNTATGDFTYTADIPDDTGIAFFRSATNFTTATRLDAVGFDPSSLLYYLGTPIPTRGTPNSQHSYVREFVAATGLPRNGNNNYEDFMMVTTGGETYSPWAATLGSPGPENLHSPIAHNSRSIRAQYIDPMRCSTCSPNRILEMETINGAPTSVLKFRRTIINNTSGPITRLRFRVIDITTLHSDEFITPQADLRVISSTDETVPTFIGTSKTARGLTREEPPDQTSTNLDGGLNTTLNAGTITLAQPLASGDSISVNFWLRRVTGGAFRFYVNIETLP